MKELLKVTGLKLNYGMISALKGIDAFQGAQRFHAFIATAVHHHGNTELRLQGGQNGGQKMGRGHQVDVFRPLGDECFKNLPQFGRGFACAHGAAGNGGVLAVLAAQGAAAEEHGAAFATRRKGRFFPLVEHGFGYQRGARTATEAQLPCRPVDPTPPGT